jgi:hypothetical protein
VGYILGVLLHRLQAVLSDAMVRIDNLLQVVVQKAALAPMRPTDLRQCAKAVKLPCIIAVRLEKGRSTSGKFPARPCNHTVAVGGSFEILPWTDGEILP